MNDQEKAFINLSIGLLLIAENAKEVAKSIPLQTSYRSFLFNVANKADEITNDLYGRLDGESEKLFHELVKAKEYLKDFSK